MRSALILLALLAPVDSLDHRLERAVQGMRRPALEGPMRAATDVGKPAIVLGGLAAVALLVRPAGAPAAVAAVVALAPTNLIVEALKRGVGRVRPDGDRNRANSSFPSSHAANAAAIAAVLARRFRKAAVPVVVLAAAVSFSRLYLDRHYPGDVLAAIVIGVGCAWGTERWLSSRWPSWFGGPFRRVAPAAVAAREAPSPPTSPQGGRDPAGEPPRGLLG